MGTTTPRETSPTPSDAVDADCGSSIGEDEVEPISGGVRPSICHYYRNVNVTFGLKSRSSQDEIFSSLRDHHSKYIFIEGLADSGTPGNCRGRIDSEFGKLVFNVFKEETDVNVKNTSLSEDQKNVLYKAGAAFTYVCLSPDVKVFAPWTIKAQRGLKKAREDEHKFKTSRSNNHEDWPTEQQKTYTELRTLVWEKMKECDEQFVARLLVLGHKVQGADFDAVIDDEHNVPMLLREIEPSRSIAVIDHFNRSPHGPFPIGPRLGDGRFYALS